MNFSNRIKLQAQGSLQLFINDKIGTLGLQMKDIVAAKYHYFVAQFFLQPPCHDVPNTWYCIGSLYQIDTLYCICISTSYPVAPIEQYAVDSYCRHHTTSCVRGLFKLERTEQINWHK